MINRLHLEDWRIIGHYLGVLILLVAVAMMVPFIMSLVLQEFSTSIDLMLSIGVTAISGSVLLFLKVERSNLDWRHSLVITGLCWVVLSVFGALPLWMSGHYDGYLDAFFESVSAFTTTGMSLCIDVDHMALSLSVWRCFMHLIGGIGVVVIALALGVFGTGSAAASLYHAEAHMGQVMPGIKQTSQFILKVAAIIVVAGSIACTIPLLFVGEEPYKAAINGCLVTAAAFSTGGMTASGLGIMGYHSWPLEAMSLVLACFGIINFVLYGDIWKGIYKNFFKDIEVRTVFIWVTALVTLMALALAGSYFTTTGAVLRRGLFEVLSGAFNLGFSTLHSGQVLFAMGSGALFVIILSMTICGSSSSASGGIKALRIGVIAKSVVQSIKEALAPDRARPRTFFFQRGKHRLTSDLVSSAMIILLLYLVMYAIGAVVGIAYGYDALSAIFDSVSAASNTGLSLGVSSLGMPKPLEVIYIIEMWLGRLEFIAIFAMIVEMLSFTIPRKKFRWIKRRKR